jgi:excinuclease UvrABC nuclease subunit
MSGVQSILDRELTFDPAGNFDAFLKTAPAKWVVYLLADDQGAPVQLLCVKNLRYSLRRRLGGEEEVGPSRRVDYRQIIRKIFYKRVDSAFAADWVYYEAARVCFPATYQGMVGFRPAWFVHVDPAAMFPRFVKTTDLSPRPGTLIGPVEDKHAAQSLIALAEDSFDLCRYYNVLTEAPGGKACAYKEMGKCAAPCDGSSTMDDYRLAISRAAAAVVDPIVEIERDTRRMKQAASELKFELAGKIKAHADGLSKLGKGPFRHARPLGDFRYVSLQRGPSRGDVNVVLITPGRIEVVLCLIDAPDRPADILRCILSTAGATPPDLSDTTGAERIGIVSHHLFSAKSTHGAFLPVASLDERSFLRAYRDVLKQKLADESDDDEGVMKELQAI